MKNKEKYAVELEEILVKHIALKDGKIVECKGLACSRCDLNGRCMDDESCADVTRRWLNEEYTEPKPKLTKRERDFIDCIIDDFYIVNDGTGLFVHFWADDVALEIYGDLFKFIKSKESMSKKELLSLEVEK